jgi:hypothetical protein
MYCRARMILRGDSRSKWPQPIYESVLHSRTKKHKMINISVRVRTKRKEWESKNKEGWLERIHENREEY